MVREIDRAAGTETLEAAALHRVVLRARETAGTISVFEGADEAVAAPAPASTSEASVPQVSTTGNAPSESLLAVPAATSKDHVGQADATAASTRAAPRFNSREEIYPTGSYDDWGAILAASGELIAAIERAINATGGNFNPVFEAVRLELADDYSFLDPISPAFEYANGAAWLNPQPPVSAYVAGLSEALRRTVDRAAVGELERRVRERVALEMLGVARKRDEVLERSGFQAHLDRIAGTRVM